VRRYQDNFRGRWQLSDSMRRLDIAWESGIHDNHIGLKLTHFLKCGSSVDCFSANFPLRGVFKNFSNACADAVGGRRQSIFAPEERQFTRACKNQLRPRPVLVQLGKRINSRIRATRLCRPSGFESTTSTLTPELVRRQPGRTLQIE